jgi:molybdopterin converting factor small subunit
MSETGSESERMTMAAPGSGTALICLHGPLRKLAGGGSEHLIEGSTVVELLRGLERSYPDLHGWILDERGRIRRHINIFVGGEQGEEQTAVRPGDRVEVLPAITGG